MNLLKVNRGLIYVSALYAPTIKEFFNEWGTSFKFEPYRSSSLVKSVAKRDVVVTCDKYIANELHDDIVMTIIGTGLATGLTAKPASISELASKGLISIVKNGCKLPDSKLSSREKAWLSFEDGVLQKVVSDHFECLYPFLAARLVVNSNKTRSISGDDVLLLVSDGNPDAPDCYESVKSSDPLKKIEDREGTRESKV